MTVDDSQKERLQFLARIVQKEADLLQLTSDRLFGNQPSVTAEKVQTWVTDVETAERLDAFVARFGRLQDTIGDKLIPTLLKYLGEPVGPAIDNLDKAERFGWVESADNWLVYRKLRNQMVHEYIEDPVVLASALEAGRGYVDQLLATGRTVAREAERRLAGN